MGRWQHEQGPHPARLARRATATHLERVPGYAPALNPTAGIWHYLKRVEKRVELGTVCCPDLPALSTAIRRGNERLRHKRHVLRACVMECGYLV